MPIVREFRAADGKVEARIIEMRRGASDESASMMARAALAPLFRASDQLPVKAFQDAFGAYDVEKPPIDPERLVSLARSEPMHRACIEAKAHAVGGQGYRIRPASDLVMSDQSVVSFTSDPNHTPDLKAKAKITAFLESGLPNYSFSETLVDTQRDVETIGQGFVEIARNGGGTPDGIYPCKGVTIRLLADGTGFVQRRGGNTRLFAKYAAGGNTTVDLAIASRGTAGGAMVQVKGWGGPSNPVPKPVNVYPPSTLDEYMFRAEMGVRGVFAANQLLMFRKGTPLDTNYGESDIVAAMYDAVGGQLAAVFNMDYFENNTVPRMAIVARGGAMSEAVIKRIEDWINGRNVASVSNHAADRRARREHRVGL